ncbi:MAG: dihydrofolate reductase [Coleofasciculaceae cyanobacterium SM2_1_6]|nr:dihydrofolate reductase [Coleofasciculaceae cyanobacterium SM2_1_6]
MSKTILYIATSLDGFIADAQDGLGWLHPFEDVDYGYAEFAAGIGAIVAGRRTYEMVAQMDCPWPYAVPMLVLSHQLAQQPPATLPEGAELIFLAGEVQGAIDQARQLTTKDIWINGGAKVAQEFLRQGLVDEIVLSIIPLILGGGIHLFGSLGRSINLILKNSQTFEKGLLQLTYNVQNIQN